jgi:hypothetical protein
MFFHERASRSDVNNGPPSVAAPLSPLPAGGRELVILIHLDHYFDWSPQPERDTNSSLSSLPSSLTPWRALISRSSAASHGRR